MNTKEIGNSTEEFVSRFLQESGYEIISRNFRCMYGEIDIIAGKDGCISAIEVKKFPPNWELYDIKYKVDLKKMTNIKKTFSVYLARNCSKKYNKIRFDVAIVTGTEISIIEDAFQ